MILQIKTAIKVSFGLSKFKAAKQAGAQEIGPKIIVASGFESSLFIFDFVINSIERITRW